MAKKKKDIYSNLPTGYPKPKFPKYPKIKATKGLGVPKSKVKGLPKVGGLPRAPRFK